MAIAQLQTKLYIPPPRFNLVHRPRLLGQLTEGLSSRRKITLISAPAGFGKTTLVSEWIATCGQPVAWLSLDEADNDPYRFLEYCIAALHSVKANIGDEVLQALQSPQPPIAESILTVLINDINAMTDQFIFVLDDYHLIDARPITEGLTFLLEHLPVNMHLVIITREDPNFPIARLRAEGQLTELRISDLRFTTSEVAEFLNKAMGYNLSIENISALEARTEGWISGLQLAAISMKGHNDVTSFIKSFTGTNHFVIDYLVEEVFQQQSKPVQTFLLGTSILDRMCGPLCDAVLNNPSGSGEETLAYLEKANLFIVPLDNERRWYRYHQLFADLLRQRLTQNTALSFGTRETDKCALNIRASQWYEDNHLEIEAFQHAANANDVERAERLIEGDRIPLHFRTAATVILNCMESLPAKVLNSRPWLQWKYAALLLVNGRTEDVEEKLYAVEEALQFAEPDEETQSLRGEIATARAILAFTQYQIENMLTQSRQALEFLPSYSLISRSTAYWTLGHAYQLQGDRTAARQALTEAKSISQASGNIFTAILAEISLGNLQETENQLYQAAETYRRVLQLAGDTTFQIVNEAHLGLARVLYEWNDMDAAQKHVNQSVQLVQQIETSDKFIASEVILARLNLAQGDIEGAAAILTKADQLARQYNLEHQIPEIAAAQVLTLLHQGDRGFAAHLEKEFTVPISQVRVHLASGDVSAALDLLEPLGHHAEAKGWEDKRLKVMVLQAVALHASGQQDNAMQRLGEALELAEPGGFVRIFVNEGAPMAQLLAEAVAIGIKPDYSRKLLDAFQSDRRTGRAGLMVSQGRSETETNQTPANFLAEPLSLRELEVLRLISKGLSNLEISKRLFLTLNTIKGHNQKIFGKLQVDSRTEAIVRARELDLL